MHPCSASQSFLHLTWPTRFSTSPGMPYSFTTVGSSGSPEHEREVENANRPCHRDERNDTCPRRALILATHYTLHSRTLDVLCQLWCPTEDERAMIVGRPSTHLAEQHHQHGERAGRGGKAEQGLEEQHGPSPNRVVADASHGLRKLSCRCGAAHGNGTKSRPW